MKRYVKEFASDVIKGNPTLETKVNSILRYYTDFRITENEAMRCLVNLANDTKEDTTNVKMEVLPLVNKHINFTGCDLYGSQYDMVQYAIESAIDKAIEELNSTEV